MILLAVFLVGGMTSLAFTSICAFVRCHANKIKEQREYDRILEEIRTWLCQECSICLDAMPEESDGLRLRCGHIYHKHCIFEWINTKNECPLCRGTAIPSTLMYKKFTDAYIRQEVF